MASVMQQETSVATATQLATVMQQETAVEALQENAAERVRTEPSAEAKAYMIATAVGVADRAQERDAPMYV